MTKNFATLFSLIVIMAGTASGFAQNDKVVVGWSIWTGWMPFKIMEKEGFLEKRSKELGVSGKVELKEFKGYMDSVTAFSAKQLAGCAMTNMEALQPASSGVKTVALVANDTSNGGDGVLVRTGLTLEGLKGKKVFLEQNSVSHYLLNRALDNAGIGESEVTIVNMPGDDAGKAFLTDKKVEAVTTWNPHLTVAQETGQGTVVFDSSRIPGEIIDLIVFREEVIKNQPKEVTAVVLAWFDAVRMISNRDTRARAVEIMAEGAGTTTAEFEKMLKGTILYTSPDETISLFGGNKIKSTMNKVKKFSADKSLISDANFEIGYKAGGPQLFMFDSSFAEKAKGPATSSSNAGTTTVTK